MISNVMGDAPFVPDTGEEVLGKYMTFRIMRHRQPVGDAGSLIITTRRVVFYSAGPSGFNLAFNLYYAQKINIKKGSVSGTKYVEFNGYRVYLGRKEAKLAYKLVKYGRRGKTRQMLSLLPARMRPATRAAASTALNAPVLHQPRPAAPQPNLTSDPIYRKGLEAVADDIINQIMPKNAASAPAANVPAATPSQSVTTISASRSMVMKPTVKTAESITTAEAAAAKRAMLERVLAPQSSEAQAIASEVMGSIASTKAVKGMKKDGAPAAGDGAAPQVPLDKTEEEVTTFKDQKICVVHKGPISGAIYLCPKCETFYCLKCATFLKKNGEKCWSCKAEMDVPDIEA
ncbi:MAG: hypothetical protein Q6353_022110 [Candidatus Sigynarchaeum springense]